MSGPMLGIGVGKQQQPLWGGYKRDQQTII